MLIGKGANRQVAMHRLMCNLLTCNRVSRKSVPIISIVCIGFGVLGLLIT